MSQSEDCSRDNIIKSLKIETGQERVPSLELTSTEDVNFMTLPSDMSASESSLTDDDEYSSVDKNISRKSHMDIAVPRVRKASSNIVTGTDVLVSTSNLNVSRAVSPETTNASLVVTSTFDFPTSENLDFIDPQLSDNRILECDVLNFEPLLDNVENSSNDYAVEPLQDSGLLKTKQRNKIRNKAITHKSQVPSKVRIVEGKVTYDSGCQSHRKQKFNLLKQQTMEKCQNSDKQSNLAKENRNINIEAVSSRTNAANKKTYIDEVLKMNSKIVKIKKESGELIKINHQMMGPERSLLTADGEKITISRTPIQCKIGEQQYVMMGYLLYQKLGYTGFQMQCFKCDTFLRNHVVQATHFRMRHHIDCCKICGEDFPNPAQVKQHETGVHKIDHLHCLSCNIRYSSYDKVMCHYNQVHETDYTCKLCRMKMKGDENWTVHQALYHTSNLDSITCSPLRFSKLVTVNTSSPENNDNNKKRVNELRPSHLVPASKRQRTNTNSKNIDNIVSGKLSSGTSPKNEIYFANTISSSIVTEKPFLNLYIKRNNTKESCEDSKLLVIRNKTFTSPVQIIKYQEESNKKLPRVPSASSSPQKKSELYISSTHSSPRENIQGRCNDKVTKRTVKPSGTANSLMRSQTKSNGTIPACKEGSVIAAVLPVTAVPSQRLIMLRPVSQRYTTTADKNVTQNRICLTSNGATFMTSRSADAHPSSTTSSDLHLLDPLKSLKDITVTKVSKQVKSKTKSTEAIKVVQISTENANMNTVISSQKPTTLASITQAQHVDEEETVNKEIRKHSPEMLAENHEFTLEVKSNAKAASNKMSDTSMKNISNATKLISEGILTVRAETKSTYSHDITFSPKIQINHEVDKNPLESSKAVSARCVKSKIVKQRDGDDCLSTLCPLRKERPNLAKLYTFNDDNESKLIEQKCPSSEQYNKSLNYSSHNDTLESNSHLEKCFVTKHQSEDQLITNNFKTINTFSEQSEILNTVHNENDLLLEKSFVGSRQDLNIISALGSTSTDVSSNLSATWSELASQNFPPSACALKPSKPVSEEIIDVKSKETANTTNDEKHLLEVIESVEPMPKRMDLTDEDININNVDANRLDLIGENINANIVDAGRLDLIEEDININHVDAERLDLIGENISINNVDAERVLQGSEHVIMGVNVGVEVQIDQEDVKSVNNIELLKTKQVVKLVVSKTENSNMIQLYDLRNGANSEMEEIQASLRDDKIYRTSDSMQSVEDVLPHIMGTTEKHNPEEEVNSPWPKDNAGDQISPVLDTLGETQSRSSQPIVYQRNVSATNVASEQSIDDELLHIVSIENKSPKGQSNLLCLSQSACTVDDEMSPILDDEDEVTVSIDEQTCEKSKEVSCTSALKQSIDEEMSHICDAADKFVILKDKEKCNKLPEQMSCSPFLKEFVKQALHFASDPELLPSDENSNIQS